MGRDDINEQEGDSPERLNPNALRLERLAVSILTSDNEFTTLGTKYSKTLEQFSITQDTLDNLISEFSVQFSKALNKKLLVQDEFERFREFEDLNKLKERCISGDFTARGYFWGSTGVTLTVRDFLLLNPKIRETDYFIEPYEEILTADELRIKWTDVITQLRKAAKGMAYAMYVSFLKEESFFKGIEPKLSTNPRNQKIKWNGGLKEFAELIDQLQLKGWIDINDGQLKSTVDSLCQIFDFSQTKKNEGSNTETSLLQYLKPSEREDKIYTKRYLSKFSSITPYSTKK